MRLYLAPFAPNPMRVIVLMREKGIDAELVDINSLPPGGFHAVNPLGQVPALVLDDGEVLTESRTICDYLDTVSGTPFLFGDTPLERARIGMWDRRAEVGLFNPAVEYGHHTHPMFVGRLKQFPDWAESLIPRVEAMLDLFSEQLGKTKFLAGEELSVADLTAAIGYFLFVGFGAIRPRNDDTLRPWAEAMIARDSMAPVRDLFAAFLPDLLATFASSALAPADQGVH